MFFRKSTICLSLLTVISVALLSCSGMGPTVFIHKNYNFNFIERVAVIPFGNLSNDQGAGERLTHIFVTELLSQEAFDIVEPGEVTDALSKARISLPADLTEEQIKEVGKTLGVQGIIIGNVNESSLSRSGSGNKPVVTLDARMVETEKGQTVWSATNTEEAGGFWSSLFGTGGESQSEVARKCVRRVIKTLVK